MKEEMFFPVEGKLYIVRKSETGNFDIFDKETGLHVNELFGKNCMKTLARKYLGLFGIEVVSQDDINAAQELMNFLKENEYVTYQRYVHVEIHKNYCKEIGKKGGGAKGTEYHHFSSFDIAKNYAEKCQKEKGLEIRYCPNCVGEN